MVLKSSAGKTDAEVGKSQSKLLLRIEAMGPPTQVNYYILTLGWQDNNFDAEVGKSQSKLLLRIEAMIEFSFLLHVALHCSLHFPRHVH